MNWPMCAQRTQVPGGRPHAHGHHDRPVKAVCALDFCDADNNQEQSNLAKLTVQTSESRDLNQDPPDPTTRAPPACTLLFSQGGLEGECSNCGAGQHMSPKNYALAAKGGSCLKVRVPETS